MGQVSQFFQPPLEWSQFEELTVGLLDVVYDVPNAQRFGSPGQSQNGVDVYGYSSRHGMIGIQCKRMSELDSSGRPFPGGPITRTLLRAEAKAAFQFHTPLKIWILATTARRNARVQRDVDELNEQWRNQGTDRTAMVWSWDECIAFLNCYPRLQRAYYQNVIQVQGSRELDEIILNTIAMAFQRPAFEVPLHCETTEEFLQALSDTQKALRTGELVDRETRQIIRKAIGGYNELSDPDLRNGLAEVNSLLKTLRADVEGGLRHGRIRRVNGFLDFTLPADADRLEALRAECLFSLNGVLARAGLAAI